MFENLSNTQIAEASPTDLDLAAGLPPAKKKTGDKTQGRNDDNSDTDDLEDNDKTKTKGKKSSGKSKDTTDTNSSDKKKVTDLSKTDLDIAAGTDDDDPDDDDPDDDDDNNDDDNDKIKKGKKKDDEDENGDPEEDDSDPEEDDENGDGPIAVKDFLAARVELLISKGEWVDFEGREDIEWDEDTFAEIELKQRENIKTQIREEVLDTFGPYGREIADYASKGGDPEQLISIFKEQQQVASFSLETEDDQRAVLLKYATEFQDMSPARAKKYIDGLVADKEIEDAAKEAKTKMEKLLKQESEDLQAEADEAVERQKKQQQASINAFNTSVVSFLKTSDIPADEQASIKKVLTNYNKKLPNGVPVNEFYFKFAEFKKDLPNYIDFVRFVLDPKKFKKTENNKGITKTAKKAFDLTRTSNMTNKKTSSAGRGDDNGPKKSKFKLL